MNLSAIHKYKRCIGFATTVVCDIGGYEFVSYSQDIVEHIVQHGVVCDIGGYEFVSYSQATATNGRRRWSCL